jgi:hypothetical protein
MKQVAALAKGKHGAEHCVAHAEALALARAGLLQATRLSSSRACTWPCKKGDARRQQVTGRREGCGEPFTEMPPKEKGAPRKR